MDKIKENNKIKHLLPPFGFSVHLGTQNSDRKISEPKSRRRIFDFGTRPNGKRHGPEPEQSTSDFVSEPSTFCTNKYLKTTKGKVNKNRFHLLILTFLLCFFYLFKCHGM